MHNVLSILDKFFLKYEGGVKLTQEKTTLKKASLVRVNLMYQALTFYSEKTLTNQKVHLQLLKSNVTNTMVGMKTHLQWKLELEGTALGQFYVALKA